MDKRILVLVLLVMGGLAWFLLQPGEPEIASGPNVPPDQTVAKAGAPAHTTSRERSPSSARKSQKSAAAEGTEGAEVPRPRRPRLPRLLRFLRSRRLARRRVPGDTAGAQSLYEDIARRGSRSAKKDAALALGDLAEHSSDHAKAFDWRQTAADNGDADSMVLVAQAYRDGTGSRRTGQVGQVFHDGAKSGPYRGRQNGGELSRRGQFGLYRREIRGRAEAVCSPGRGRRYLGDVHARHHV